MSFNVGENVGPYRVMEQLGQGGMATVFKAYHASLDRYVALKVLHTAFGEDPNFEARFQREARLVAKLEHPNIVPVYDYAEHTGRKYLVMKYIEGETLKARLARGPLASDELNKIIVAVGSALAYAHKMGILHRDIKPSNVLLTTDGSIYLADFGLARIASAGESTLSGDMIMGTPQYISPEQAMGKKELDEGTDIYSFGVMLYEMVVGQVPFSADTPFSIIHDHIYTPLPMPRNINPEVPEAVERVLLKALAKERADRYPDIAALVHAFQHSWTEAGVPMKGTTVTLSAKEVSAKAAPALASQKEATPATEKPAAVADVKPKKKRSPWMIASVAGILLLCCLFFVLASNRQKIFRGNGQATETLTEATGTALEESTPVVVEATGTVLAPLPPGNLIDDFEGAPPPGTSGWEAYFGEDAGTNVNCAVNSESAHSGAKSLRIQFDIPAHSWGTCGIYFDGGAQDWGRSQGISFFLRVDRAGLPFEVAVYSGSANNRSTYIHPIVTPPGSENTWTLIEIRWTEFLRAEWEENPGTPFHPAEATGFSIGISGSMPELISGAISLDDLKFFGEASAGPGSEIATPTQSPAVLEALKLVEQNPNDPNANLQLSLAYWDNGQAILSFQALNTAANLAPPVDRPFFLNAAQEFARREAWIASAAMYIRAMKAVPANGPVAPELEAAMHEAVYKASASPEMPNFLPFDSVARIDQPISLIAHGRFSLYTGDTVLAREYVNRVKKLNPNMAEASLLEAEILVKEGQRESAKKILQELSSNLGNADWIRKLADEYLLQFQ